MNTFISLIKNVAALTKDEIEDEKEEELVLPGIIQGASKKLTGRKHSLCQSTSKEPNKVSDRRLSVPMLNRSKREYKADNVRSFTTPSTLKRTSFHALGARIRRLVNVRDAFVRRKGKGVEDDSIFEEFLRMNKNRLPKEPRISTTMSPEAMYAAMKGYEDIAHHYLSRSNPECRNTLKRSITHASLLKIKPGSGPGNMLKSNIDPEVNKKPCCSKLEKDQSATISCLTPISRDRQFELTFRLQNAMDIVDSVKGNLGYYTTSPWRPLSKALQNPVRCYNKWTDVWKEEFSMERNRS